MSTTTPEIAEIFAALGDPSRQQLIQHLARHGQASATALAEPLPVSRQAVDKHLRTLQRAGLVTSERSGREVLYALRRDELDRTAVWLTELAMNWDKRLQQIKVAAESVARSAS